jgi:hypothetical protein
MNLKRSFLTVTLALGLLLPSLAGADESIQRSVDEKGTIRIRSTGSAGKEKAGAQGGEVKSTPEQAGAKEAPPRPEARPGFLPPTSRRSRGGFDPEARRRAFERAHPNLGRPPQAPQPQQPPTPPAAQAPPAPLAPPAQPPAPGSQ